VKECEVEFSWHSFRTDLNIFAHAVCSVFCSSLVPSPWACILIIILTHLGCYPRQTGCIWSHAGEPLFAQEHFVLVQSHKQLHFNHHAEVTPVQLVDQSSEGVPGLLSHIHSKSFNNMRFSFPFLSIDTLTSTLLAFYARPLPT